jgi:cation:H+ antiporter
VLNAPTGVALLIGLAGYVANSYRSERLVAENGARAGKSESTGTGGESRWLPSGWSGSLIAVLGCVAGIALLAFGGRMLVEAAVLLANDLGVSDTVIGLTVVAVGTSLPELATSVVAAFRRQSDIAFGNVVGSNIFNVLGIGGLTGLLVSGEIPSRLAMIDFPIMLGVTALLVVVAATGRRIGRVEGAMLVTAFGVYLGIVGFTAAS